MIVLITGNHRDNVTAHSSATFCKLNTHTCPAALMQRKFGVGFQIAMLYLKKWCPISHPTVSERPESVRTATNTLVIEMSDLWYLASVHLRCFRFQAVKSTCGPILCAPPSSPRSPLHAISERPLYPLRMLLHYAVSLQSAVSLQVDASHPTTTPRDLKVEKSQRQKEKDAKAKGLATSSNNSAAAAAVAASATAVVKREKPASHEAARL